MSTKVVWIALVLGGLAVAIVLEGKRVRRRFSVKAEQELRMRPEAALWDNAMTVSRIDRLFGPAISTDLIRGQD